MASKIIIPHNDRLRGHYLRRDDIELETSSRDFQDIGELY